MAKVSKRMQAANAAVVGKGALPLEEAIALVKSNASARFDETVELAPTDSNRPMPGAGDGAAPNAPGAGDGAAPNAPGAGDGAGADIGASAAGGETDNDAAATLAPVYRRLEEVEIPELAEAKSFAVRCRRVGTHPFSSPQVEREAGAVLYHRFGVPANLTSPECTVRVDVTDSTARIGVLYGGEAISRRFNWVWRPRVTLRNTIAYGLLRLGGYQDLPPGSTLLDPFCGSGTIPVEAASLREDVRLLASDWDAGAIEGMRKNLEATCYAERIEVAEANALAMDEFYGADSADLVVTNPPFGVRLAKDTNMLGFYHSFLRAARLVVKPGGRLVILVGRRRKLFNNAVEQFRGWRIVHVRIIEFGGIFPGVFILE